MHSDNNQINAAVYHFTNQCAKRPIIYQKQIELLKIFASSKGFWVSEVYCDKSLQKRFRPEFERFWNEKKIFDVLIAKDYYHLSKNTKEAFTLLQELRENGIQVFTPENGHFEWDIVPTEKTLKVATYCSRFGHLNDIHEVIPVQKETLALFIQKKTNWILVDQYVDERQYQQDKEQRELKKLMQNKDKYNLILVHNLSSIHWRTARFCKIREHLKLDIYSLQDGFLKYDSEERLELRSISQSETE